RGHVVGTQGRRTSGPQGLRIAAPPPTLAPLQEVTGLDAGVRRCLRASGRGGLKRRGKVSRHLLAPAERGVRRLELRSEEHTSELHSLTNLVCRRLLGM